MKKFALAAVLALGLAATPAVAKTGVKIGVLSCEISGGVGLIITSTKSLACDFEPNHGRHEHYEGSITKLGLDLGVTHEGTLVWAVFAPGKINHGALAGNYVGASAEATVAVGLGANALVGGSDKSIALQPLSIQTQTGLNVAAGIAGLQLHRAH